MDLSREQVHIKYLNMENVDDAEKSTLVCDSAYSYSCSNSKSTWSSNSTLSESNSSGSSGYRGKRPAADYSKGINAQPTREKRAKEEPEIVQIDLKPEEVKSSDVTEVSQFESTSLSTNEDLKEQTSDVYLSPSPPVVGGFAGKTENMDISTSDQSNKQNVNGFFCVISMHDGIVMYTTLSISSALGFPQDMWIGRSFTDFIHPKDHNTFASQVSNDLTLRKNVNASYVENHASTIFCRIRRHKILTSGFGIKDRIAAFVPFLLKFFFKNINDENVIYLVIQAIPYFSAFKTANEKVTNAVPFTIKHSANGDLKYIDRESVSYLGYLPQDIMDKDTLELYHPGDLTYLHQVYETLIREGSLDRCKPYRMMAQNGDYVKLETEWFSFINPWSRKLEYVVGKHYIIEGPTNPDVFQSPSLKRNINMDDEETDNSETLRNNIKILLSEVLTKPAKVAKEQMNKRCQDIATFMENFIDKTLNNDESSDLLDTIHSPKADSIKLCGLSSHDYTESKSSTDTPISYNQLNYDETLQRFFDSHELCVVSNHNVNCRHFKQNEPGVELRTSNTVNVSDIQMACISNTDHLNNPSSSSMPDNQNIWLTESLLHMHNEKMEKELVKSHRKCRSIGKGDKDKGSDSTTSKRRIREHIERCNASYQPTSASNSVKTHGLKRSLKMSTPVPHKVSGSTRALRRRRATAMHSAHQPTPTVAPPRQATYVDNDLLKRVGIAQQISLANITGMVPMYYATQPLPPIVDRNMEPCGSKLFQGQNTVPFMMYGQAVCGIPYTYSPINQLSYTLEQSCMKQYINPIHTPSNYGETTDTTQDRVKNKMKCNSDGTVYNTDEESSFSSFYSSFFKTESGSAEESEAKKGSKEELKFWSQRNVLEDTNSAMSCDINHGKNMARRKMNPPWMEQVHVTSELMYKYQIKTKDMEEVLSSDRKKLETLEQPPLVNEQLGQLYLDLQLEGGEPCLALEEGVISSSDSSDEMPEPHCSKTYPQPSTEQRKAYKRMVTLYDDDASLPLPDGNLTSVS